MKNVAQNPLNTLAQQILAGVVGLRGIHTPTGTDRQAYWRV